MARFPDPPAGMNVRAYPPPDCAERALERAAGCAPGPRRRSRDDRSGADDQLDAIRKRGGAPRRAASPRAPLRHASDTASTTRTDAERCRRPLVRRDRIELGIGADAVAQVISRHAALAQRRATRAGRPRRALARLSRDARSLSDYVDGPRLLEHTRVGGASRRLRTLPPHARLLSGSRPATSRRRAAGAARRSARPPRRGDPRRRRRSLGIATVASLATAAALAVGGGGMLVAQRLTESPPAQRALPSTTPRHAAATIPVGHSSVTGRRSLAASAPSGSARSSAIRRGSAPAARTARAMPRIRRPRLARNRARPQR